MEDLSFYFKYFGISLLFVIAGIMILKYFKNYRLNDLNKVLGLGIFWIKLFAYLLLIAGTISFVSFSVALFYDLKLNNII